MNEHKFDGKSSSYAAYRPSYPKALYDYLESKGIHNCTVCDVGSGTGIFTKGLLERGNTVYAVEPNEDMRSEAEKSLSHYKGFISVCGKDSDTTLKSASADFVTVAQAFHWFDEKAFKSECARILRPDGKVALVWNTRGFDENLMQETSALFKKYCPDFKGYSNNKSGNASPTDFKDFFKGDAEVREFENPFFADLDKFIGRALSSSYSITQNDPMFPYYVQALETLFNKYAQNGEIQMRYTSTCYFGSVI